MKPSGYSEWGSEIICIRGRMQCEMATARLQFITTRLTAAAGQAWGGITGSQPASDGWLPGLPKFTPRWASASMSSWALGGPTCTFASVSKFP